MAAAVEPTQIDLIDIFSERIGIYHHKPGCYNPLGEECAECISTETSDWYNKYEHIRKFFGLPYLQSMLNESYIDEGKWIADVQTWIVAINKYCDSHELHFRVKDVNKNDSYIFLTWHRVYFTYLNQIIEDNLHNCQILPVE